MDDDTDTLLFTTSTAPEHFAKTPANVKGDYLSVHHPHIAISPPQAPKRKASTSLNATPESSSSKKPRQSPKKRTRDPSKKQSVSRIIPRCLDECGDADQELIRMRDAGEDWKVIRERYQEISGQNLASSTLPNRYARLKSNFTILPPSTTPHLLAAKKQVESAFEAQKWDLIANVVREKTGGEVYAGCVLQRQYKKVMVQMGVVPPKGVRDGDWEVEVLP